MFDILRRVLPFLMADGDDGGGVTATATETDDTGGTGGDGTTHSDGPGWRQVFTKEYQGAPELADFNTPTELFKGYLTQREKIAGLQPPDADASDEDWDRFHQQMGAPESPDDYRLPTLKGVEDPEEFQKWFRESAAGVKLTARQGRRLYDAYAKRITEAVAAQAESVKTERAEALKVLKQEWGDEFTGRVELANRAFNSFSTDEDVKEFEKEKLLDNPRMIRYFAKIGDVISEDHLEGGRPAQSGNGLREINPATGHRRFTFPK